MADRRAVRDRANYGYDAAFDGDVRDILTKPGVHDFRLHEIAGIVGGEPYFRDAARRMLDIGCGTAPLTFTALAAGVECYGIDLDYEKVAMAHAKIGAFGYPDHWRNNIRLASAYQLPYDTETFDVVTSFQVLEHLDRLASGLYESVRVTRRGGWIVFRAPDYRMSFEPHYRLPWLQFAPPWVAERWVMAMDRPPGGLDTFYYITLPQVASMLEALDCDVVVSRLDAIVQGRYVAVERPIAPERLLVNTEAEIIAVAERLKADGAAGRLDPAYSTELSFLIAARRR